MTPGMLASSRLTPGCPAHRHSPNGLPQAAGVCFRSTRGVEHDLHRLVRDRPHRESPNSGRSTAAAHIDLSSSSSRTPAPNACFALAGHYLDLFDDLDAALTAMSELSHAGPARR